jgi:hypothetical protein
MRRTGNCAERGRRVAFGPRDPSGWNHPKRGIRGHLSPNRRCYATRQRQTSSGAQFPGARSGGAERDRGRGPRPARPVPAHIARRRRGERGTHADRSRG